jgi:hypothetical protein
MKIKYAKGQAAEDFAQRIETSEMILKLATALESGTPVFVHEVEGIFMVTESHIHVSGEDSPIKEAPYLQIRAMQGNRATKNCYPLGKVDPYTAETALFLGIHPAKLALNLEAANAHLKSFGAGEQEISLYRDLGMSTKDTAQAIRMQQQVAQSGEDDSQASSDYLASLDGDVFAQDDQVLSSGAHHGF